MTEKASRADSLHELAEQFDQQYRCAIGEGEPARLPELIEVANRIRARLVQLEAVIPSGWLRTEDSLRRWIESLQSKPAPAAVADEALSAGCDPDTILKLSGFLARRLQQAKADRAFSLLHGDVKVGVPELGLDPVPEATLSDWVGNPGYQRSLIINYPERDPERPRKDPAVVPGLLRFRLSGLLDLQAIRRRRQRKK